MRIGYFLSCEEFGPRAAASSQARLAQDAGLDRLWISDHYHPWIDEQGESPFVWSVIGALATATPGMHVTTAVTCPTVRIHPAIIAQAAATSAVLLDGRFALGVGSGEALNEHILADAWPEADVRQEMLEEAIEVMRGLWEGRQFSHYGPHYAVENARIYTLPGRAAGHDRLRASAPSRSTSPRASATATAPSVPTRTSVDRFRVGGGGDKIVQGGTKVCFGPGRGGVRQDRPPTVAERGARRASSRRSSPSPRTSSRRPSS